MSDSPAHRRDFLAPAVPGSRDKPARSPSLDTSPSAGFTMPGPLRPSNVSIRRSRSTRGSPPATSADHESDREELFAGFGRDDLPGSTVVGRRAARGVVEQPLPLGDVPARRARLARVRDGVPV